MHVPRFKREARYKVVTVEMFDVVDGDTGEVIFNTRDLEQARRYADEHEKLFGRRRPARTPA